MLIFRGALFLLSVTYIYTLCFQVVQEASYLDAGLAFLYVASGAIVAKIVYDRYKHVHIFGNLTPDPRVTSFANNIASVSAALLIVAVLVYVALSYLQVDDRCLTALSIFICGLSTLYLWMQCIITTYIASLYLDENVAILRQCLANLSLLVLIVMTLFSAATSLLPRGASAIYICMVITTLSSYTLAAIFGVFILAFEKDYRFFTEGVRTESLLDETCVSNASSTENLFQSQVSRTQLHKSYSNNTKPS